MDKHEEIMFILLSLLEVEIPLIYFKISKGIFFSHLLQGAFQIQRVFEFYVLRGVRQL